MITKQQADYFKNSRIRNKDGTLKVYYHGTPNHFESFDEKFTGDGNDSYGSGFYFTSDYNGALGYLDSVTGGNVITAYLNIEKPIIIDGRTSTNLSDIALSDIFESTEEVGKVLRFLPGLYLDKSSETMNPLGDYFEEYWMMDNEKENYDLLINLWASEFYEDSHLLHLQTLFKDYPTELRYGLSNALGYDGIIIDFEDSGHVVAWFPEQIKDINNQYPKKDKQIYGHQKSIKERILSITSKFNQDSSICSKAQREELVK